MLLYTDDSDGNRVDTYQVRGTWLVLPSLDVQLTADARALEQERQDAVPSRETRSAELVLSLMLGRGWTVSAGGGVRTGTADDQESIGLMQARVASPSYLPVSASVGFRRSAFDYTAQLAGNDVTVDEVALSLIGKTSGNRLRLSARGSIARFEADERNTRWLAVTTAMFRATSVFSFGLNARVFGFQKDVNAGYWAPELYGILDAPLRLSSNSERFLGTVEVAPGYQTIDHPRIQDQGLALRATATLGYRFSPGRSVGVTGILANSGVQRISPVPEADYEYRAVQVFVEWVLR
jgi:hypothetical protein